MNKLTETLKKLMEKWSALSKTRKIALGLISLSFIIAIISAVVVLGSTKYAVLFSELDGKDSGAVIANLKEKKIDYKVNNTNTILVPEEQADALRMEVISEVDITGGSAGWELFQSSGMVATDFENNVKYQRALSGSIARMIKTFDEVKDASINLVLPPKTVFVREEEPARAAVVIKLKPGVKKLTDSQVKGIVALLTGSVDNLPKENVYIVVNGITLVTEGLFDAEGNEMVSSDEQFEMRKERETDLKQKVMDVLRDVYGSDVKVAVNLDMNFDAIQTESTTYEKGVLVSEQGTTNSTGSGDNFASNSPIDNNMTNSFEESNSLNTQTESTSYTRNYLNPEKKQIHIESPGKIDKMTVSVVVNENDGVLDERTKSKVRNLVASAVGYKPDRGDSITVEGLSFKNDVDEIIAIANKEMAKETELLKKQELIKYIGYGITALIILILMFVVMRKLGKKEAGEMQGFDMVVGDNIQPKTEQVFDPIDFETDDEKTHMANEVKKYAKDKPEQVADIVKSWLAEDEG